MEFVHEVVDAFPFTEPAHTVRRHESLLLASPIPGFLSTWRDPSPIELVHIAWVGDTRHDESDVKREISRWLEHAT